MDSTVLRSLLVLCLAEEKNGSNKRKDKNLLEECCTI